MKILSVLGLALLIITLKFLIPNVFTGFENALLAFFELMQAVFAASRSNMTAGYLPSFQSLPVQ